MHALVPSVLLRLAGSDPLRLNPGLDHENRKPGHPSDAGGGERRTVVGAKPERQAEFAEGGVEHRPDVLGVAPGQHLTAQQIAAVRVGERQRFATGSGTSPVTNQPLKSMHQTSLAAPQWPNGALEGGPAAAQPALYRQAFAIEQEADRARRRPIDRRRLPPEKGAHLQRPPGRMRPAYHNADAGDLVRNHLRVMVGHSRAIEQTLYPRIPITSKPFVACFLAHPELPAQRGQRLLSRFSAAITKRILSSTAQVSFHPIGKALLADQLTCHPCRRSILSPM